MGEVCGFIGQITLIKVEKTQSAAGKVGNIHEKSGNVCRLVRVLCTDSRHALAVSITVNT
ncbi:hypothetical protein ACIDEJ_14470 [Shewanella sp. YIC-542]